MEETAVSLVVVDGIVGGCLPADDPGLLLGLSVFETLRSYGARPFRLGAHLRRLADSAERMGLPFPGEQVLREELLEHLGEDQIIRLTLTQGGHRVLQLRPVDPGYAGRPVALASCRHLGLWGQVKHGSRAPLVLEARARGVPELLLLDEAGLILEASNSNVFGVVEGRLRTPVLDGRVLPGITRQAALEAAEQAGLPLDQGPLPVGGPLWLSSSLKELAPVSELDGRPLPGHPLGERLRLALRALIARETA